MRFSAASRSRSMSERKTYIHKDAVAKAEKAAKAKAKKAADKAKG